ncbi:MAG: amino acid adenylation domain-containing protein [Acidovorax sp.]
MSTLVNRVLQRPEALKTRPAIVFLQPDLVSTETLTHAELAQASQAIAALLLNTVRPGDRVLLAYDNCLEAVLLFWGCMVAGVVAVPAPAPDARRSTVGWRRLQAMCEDAQVAMAFTRNEHHAAALAQIPNVRWSTLDGLGDWRGGAPTPAAFRPAGPQDLAYLQYTSGSTGRPRGVQITHANLLAQCEALTQDNPWDPLSSRFLTWLPWFHDYGLVHGLLAPAYTGAASYLMSTQQFLLRPLRWLEAIARHGITYSGAPDFAYEACVNALTRAKGWDFRLDHWQIATCGAEPIRPRTLQRFFEAFSRFGFRPEVFTPSYGMAETVLSITLSRPGAIPKTLVVDRQSIERGQVQEVQAAAADSLTLVGNGRVLPRMEVRIVHPETRRPCPANEVGEIWVRGACVGQGYWNQPAASAEKFAVLIDEPGAVDTFLRTGDLGFFKDGELFVTGRYSDLIIVHGRNIHPQDLEDTAQRASEWIRPRSVIACPVEHAGRECIVLLVECRNQLTPGNLASLQADLRHAIADAHQVDLLEIVLLRSGVLPRTSSGKLQRRDARRMYLAGELASSQLQATPEPARATDEPAGGLATELAALWADVLNLPHVPPDAHFLHLGGDSLTATQLLSRVQTHWGVDLPISTLFADPSLQGMTRALAAKLATARPPAQADTAQAEPDSPELLSYSQERMWFMQALAPASSAYNVPLALRLQGALDADRLEQAFKALISHHEILRTRFVTTDLGPVAEVVDDWDFQLTRLDAPPGGEAGLAELMSRLSQQAFKLDRWPLMRATLIRFSPDEHVLLTVLHHIVADQWSFAVLGRDLSTAYRQARPGIKPALSGPPSRFASYAGWHRRWFETERQQQEAAYWRQRLDGLQPIALAPDRPRPRQASFRGASVRLPLPSGITNQLASLAASQDATLAMALLAVFKIFLRKHTGQTDLALGMPIANRHHHAGENLIGTLVNTLIIRTSLEGDPDFTEVLQRVKAAALGAYEHQDMPFELLVRMLDHKREPAQTPLFNVMFNLVNTPVRDVDFGDVSWSRVDVERQASQVDLTVVVDPHFDHSIVLEYATDLFEAESVQRMGRQLLTLLQSALQGAHTPISQWTLLDPAQRQQVLSWGAGPQPPSPEMGLAAFLEQGLALAPQATALIFGEQRLSYAELDRASQQWAGHLQARGLSGCRIGLCLPRSAELVIALLATIRSGATYVPLDPLYPEERIGYQIEDAGLSLIIGTQQTLAARRAGPVPCLSMDEDWPDPQVSLRPDAGTQSPAYLIYTSGSTGRPKGVCVPQHAVVNFLRSMAREPGLQHGDRVLAVTTLGFDIAVLELLLPLSVGATIVLASDSEATDGTALKALIEAHAITLMQATPSRWRLLIEAGWSRRPDMRALVGGEPLPPALAHELAQRCDAVWNMYGPTETTVWSSCWRVQPDAPITLGQAIDHTQILVLDEAGQLAPAGAWGEIWIGGRGVADGYWQRPELTSERFRVPACLDGSDGKAYRTGDRGRWRHDGSLEHGGRLDDQVKLRGFRVELGEIEAFLASQADVQHCVALVREDSPGDQRLVAYIVSAQVSVNMGSLRARARRWLPNHMVPAVFMQIPALPVLPNGKIDRKSLPVPTGNATPVNRRQTPRNETEQRLWAIWQDLLQHGDFGVDDSFFDLGGHSMLAARMINRVQTEFRSPFSLSMLFEQPTVSGMAQQLAVPHSGPDLPTVVLRHGRQQPALFLLAGTQMYQELARQLTIDMSVHGLFSQAEIDLLDWPVDQPLPPFPIEVLAGAYVDLIRARQPHGPYYLGGFSIGGVLAYEVAQRLIAAGEEIGLLVMLDCALPGRGWKRLKAGITRRARMIRRDGWGHFTHLYRQMRVLKASSAQPGGRRNQVYAQAILEYQARASTMPVAFFQAAGDASTEPAYGWGALAPNMTIELVPGKHADILETPNVSELARHLSRQLLAAQHPALAMDSSATARPICHTD